MSQPENEIKRVMIAELYKRHGNVLGAHSIDELGDFVAALASRAPATTPTISKQLVLDWLTGYAGPEEPEFFEQFISKLERRIKQGGSPQAETLMDAVAMVEDEGLWKFDQPKWYEAMAQALFHLNGAQAAAPGGKEIPARDSVVAEVTKSHLAIAWQPPVPPSHPLQDKQEPALGKVSFQLLTEKDVAEAYQAAPDWFTVLSALQCRGKEPPRDELDFGSAEEVIAGLDRINEHNRQVAAQDKPTP